jgi:hypothetical protein
MNPSLFLLCVAAVATALNLRLVAEMPFAQAGTIDLPPTLITVECVA